MPRSSERVLKATIAILDYGPASKCYARNFPVVSAATPGNMITFAR